MRIDHLVLLVPDLNAATRQWARRGYTITPGGTHADGHTHNVLICLADTSYIELIAFRVPGRTPHVWDPLRPFPGLIDFAVRVPDIDAAVAKLGRQGLAYAAPKDGGRARPDGVALRWRGARPLVAGLGLPFLIEDVTARALRVPSGPARRHRNGVTGIATLDVLTRDLGAALPAFGALFGRATDLGAGSVTFRVGATTLWLRQPSRGNAAALLAMRGAGPSAWTAEKARPAA